MRKMSLLLAFLLALTAVVPAHASGAETEVTSEIELGEAALMMAEAPVVHVTVPATGRIVLNPYGLPVEIGGGTSTEQIASETMTITNNGSTPVAVSASAVGRVSELSEMRFSTVPPAADTVEKEIFLYAEFQGEDGQWRGGYRGEQNQLLIFGAAGTEKEVLTLDAGPSEGVFRLFGAVTTNPEEPWSSDDGVSVTLTFTFTALEAATEEQRAEEAEDEPVGEPTEAPVEEPLGEGAADPGADQEPDVEDTPEGEPSDTQQEGSGSEADTEPADEHSQGVPGSPSVEETGDPVLTGGEESTETDG